MKKAIAIFGFGYTAQYFTKLLVTHNYFVKATSRDPQKRRCHVQPNLQLLDFTPDSADALLQDVEAVLVTAAPTEQGEDPTLCVFEKQILQHADHLKWVGYLSSTGVYGDYQGAWVDENAPLRGSHPTARNRIAAESAWLKLYQQHRLPIHIFRCAGIYGPDRNSLARIVAGKDFTVVKPGHYFSRIHVEDIAQVLWCSLNHPTPGEIFNLADDRPAPLHEVELFAAKLLQDCQLRRIPIEAAELSARALEFYQVNRRVSNAKIKSLLNYQLKFPNYEAGLLAIKAQLSQ